MKIRLGALFFLIFAAAVCILSPKTAFASSITLSGKVSDAVGNGITGATVAATDATTQVSAGSTTTDSNGNYTLLLSGGTYNIQVTPPSGSNFSSTVAVNQVVSSNTTLNFVLTPSGNVTLSGHIYDVSGSPLPGQTISLQTSDGSQTTTAVTDSNGSYSLQVTAGVYTLNISASNNSFSLHSPQQYTLTKTNYSLSQSTLINFTLPLNRVSLHVLGTNGLGVSGANVAVAPTNSVSSNSLTVGNIAGVTGKASYTSAAGVTTDSSGTATVWLFPNDQSNSYTFTVTPPSNSGYLTTNLSNVFITGDANTTMTLQTPVTLSGHVYNRSGQAVPNQTVLLQGSGASATTDTNGNYSLAVSPGTYVLEVTGNNNSSSSGVPQFYDITANNYSLSQNTTFDITVPTEQVTLHTQDAANSAVSGIAISALGLNGQGDLSNTGQLSIGGGITNASGIAEYGTRGNPAPQTDSSGNTVLWLFPNSTNKAYNFTGTPASGSGFLTTSLSNVSITTDTTKQLIMQQQPVTLSGQIVNISGNPLPGQKVFLQAPDGSQTTATTDTNGNYSLQVASGTYKLDISASTNSSTLQAPQRYELTKSNYSLTQNTVLNVTLPLNKISIHVQDNVGNPLSNIVVSALPTNTLSNDNVTLGTLTGVSGKSSYTTSGGVTTDNSGNAVLWLFPNDQAYTYTFTATPPVGSNYNTFTLNNVAVTGDQTELISLQYQHAAPVTTASLATENADGTYSNPTTVNLSATAASGYSIANTFYTIDGGSQQTYTAPFTVSTDGGHSITYWSVDTTGITEITNTLSFTIHSTQAPVVGFLGVATLHQGDTYSWNGTFTDASGTSWTATVDYGDGSGIQPLPLSGQSFLLNHKYTQLGTFTLIVTVTSNLGKSGTGKVPITVIPVGAATFDDLAPNTTLTGTYDGIDFSSGNWMVDGPITSDTTNSISFVWGGMTSGTFSFPTPQILVSTDIESNDTQTALVTLSCPGNAPVNTQVAAGAHLTVNTNWTTPCTTVNVTSSNSWNTNLDNIVYSTQNPGAQPQQTPTPPSGNILGYATQGSLLDVYDAGYMNGSKFTTNAIGGTASSMSVFVGNVDTGTHNQYQVAIYADQNGDPGALLATASGTLSPLSWNTVPIKAILAPNTAYWLMYNTNASIKTDYENNMYYDTSADQTVGAYAKHSFGSWPTKFPSTYTGGNWQFSMYVTYN